MIAEVVVSIDMMLAINGNNLKELPKEMEWQASVSL